MRFVLYTTETVSQCMNALNQRMQAKGTKARPELNGWIEKSGTFSLSITTKVAGRFPRSTRLNGKVKREKGVTTIKGYVSDGISPQWLRILFFVIAVVIIGLLIGHQLMLALLMVFFSAVFYIPMRGDYVNSDLLLIEVEKTLKASPKPPK